MQGLKGETNCSRVVQEKSVRSLKFKRECFMSGAKSRKSKKIDLIEPN